MSVACLVMHNYATHCRCNRKYRPTNAITFHNNSTKVVNKGGLDVSIKLRIIQDFQTTFRHAILLLKELRYTQ